MLNPIFRLIVAALFVALGSYLINQLPPIPDFRDRKVLTLCLTFEIAVLSFIVTAWKEFFSKSSSFQVAAGAIGVIVLVLFFWHISQLKWRIYQAWKLSHLTHQNKIKVLKTPKDWRRELLKAMKRDVEARLNDSLHNHEIIRVGTQTQSQHLGKTPLVTNNGENQFESGKPMIEFLDRLDIPGCLVILGEPGAGKTTLLLELARDLIERAQQNPDDPIPVLFELTNWRDDKQAFGEWLMADLKFRYNVPDRISSQWFDTEFNQKSKVLPLLDGLDELSLTRQKKCIHTINDILQNHPSLFPLFVCCRREESEQGEGILSNLQSTVYLQALSERQIQAYLQQVGFPDLWENIHNDPDGLGELAKIPLFLSLIPLAYPNSSQNQVSGYQVQRFNSEKERKKYQNQIRKDLFDTYIHRKLRENHDRKGYKLEDTKGWLIWLAKKMENHNLQEFYIEKMEPSYLGNILEKTQYSLTFGLIYGLTFGLISGSMLGLSYERTSDLILIVIYGLIYGFIFTLMSLLSLSINARENLKIGFDFKAWLIFVLIVGLVIMLIPGLIPGLMILLIFMLNKGTQLSYKKNPNQGIQESGKNILVFIFIFLPIVMSFLAAAAVHIHGQNLHVASIVIREFLAALIFCIAVAGIPVMRHIFLRLILWKNRSIPWNYGHFLTYASDRKLIHQVGGRFTFLHALLQEHFARMG